MSAPKLDTLVIGAGQAGLAISCCLKQRQIPHAVLERGRVGHSWRAQRWDSFHLNTPNAVNLLPGDEYRGDAPSGFAPSSDLLSYFEDYRRRHELPIEEGVEVSAVRRVDQGFEVETGDGVRTCRNLVVCSGDQNEPQTPALAAEIPSDIVQLHSAEYRSPAALPEGSTLLVGAGQSGVQIAEDLLEASRKLYFSTSKVGRGPRRYRGKDLFSWLLLAGFGEQRPKDLQDPNEVFARQPQISGTRGGHTVSLQQLARDGATLLGRLAGVSGRTLSIDGNLEANVAKADEVSAKLKGAVDMFIAKSGIEAPAAEPDPVEAPFAGIGEMAAIRSLDLDRANIRSIIWATGYAPKFNYLGSDLLDERGYPRHREGLGEVPGLYCLGFTWLRRRFSGVIPGVADDAEHVADHIAQRRAQRA